MTHTDRESGETIEKEVTLTRDEGHRPETMLADLEKLLPVFKGGRYVKEGRFITG
jgi:acetyl-CoA C-acetyltransferase